MGFSNKSNCITHYCLRVVGNQASVFLINIGLWSLASVKRSTCKFCSSKWNKPESHFVEDVHSIWHQTLKNKYCWLLIDMFYTSLLSWIQLSESWKIKGSMFLISLVYCAWHLSSILHIHVLPEKNKSEAHFEEDVHNA